MAKLEILKVTTGTTIFLFKGTAGLYDGGVSTATGITKALENEQDLPTYRVAELIQNGVLFRLTAKTQNAAGRKGSLKMLCFRAKLATVLDELNEEPYSITNGSSGTIKSVGFSTRVVSRT
jgi:hypothetical protein